MEADIASPIVDDKSVEVRAAPTSKAPSTRSRCRHTSPTQGLKDFADIAKFKDQLDGKIYGIEPGNDGNRLILDMIEEDKFGLERLRAGRELSEQGMLAAGRARRRSATRPIVFLGWEPHPMNTNFKMTYLTGGDDVFGPNFGGATVYTNVRAGYLERMPERRQAAAEPEVHPAMENEIMGKILDDGEEPPKAAEEWLKANPACSMPGSPASRPSTAARARAVKKSLGL